VVRAQAGTSTPASIEENCVGCNLCSLVHPVDDCIAMERHNDGAQHLTWEEGTAASTIPTEFDGEKAGGRHPWVPGPVAALGKERHKTLPGKAWAWGIGQG
jgi:dihydropyrimidine dehydrogenase (NAD+) subunit PreA